MSKKSNMVLKSAHFRKHVKICLVFLTLLTILNLTALSLALFFQIKNSKLTGAEIFKNNINGIVEVKAYTEDVGESFGTAEFIDSDGRLVTNAHVVTYTSLSVVNTFEKYYIRFATDEEYIEVSLIKYDTDLDIAVLQMNPTIHKFTTLTTADSSKIETGDKVYAMGNTANYGISMSEGIVGSPLININYNNITRSVIQCSITIAEGNSGGALLDDDGKLIGITTFRTKDSSGNPIYGIAYCIPINTVLEYIK
ncbi:MAG: trypsin-like peptidase domain-containing protein [Clostridia bacterium]|nr:trypsin-like peptidase domain-containing protein [Clostridia bacterium]